MSSLSAKNGHFSLAVLDVGHGNCAVVSSNQEVVVVDAGPTKAGLLDYLREAGFESIKTILISHADADHITGLRTIISEGSIKVDKVRLNTDSMKGTKEWDDLLWELDQNPEIDFQPSLTSSQAESYDIGSIKIEIVAPSAYLAGKGPGSVDRKKRNITTNSVSAVIRISLGDNPVALITGDIDEVGLANLVESSGNANAPIVVFPHHGGKSGTDKLDNFARQICDVVSPKVVIFSIGRGKYNTPRPEIVKVIKEYSEDIRIICTQLSEHCLADLPSAEPEYLDRTFSKGRECRKCCAGSIIIDLGDTSNIHPSVSEHQAFITSSAPSALCN